MEFCAEDGGSHSAVNGELKRWVLPKCRVPDSSGSTHSNAFIYSSHALVLIPTCQQGSEEQVYLDTEREKKKRKPTWACMRMNDFWSQKGLCMNPALSLSSCVSSGKSLHLSEPWFPCLYNGCMQCLHNKSPVKTKLDREIKYVCYSIAVSKIGLFKMVHRIRTEN